MLRKILQLFPALALIGGYAHAQSQSERLPCASDIMTRQLRAAHPEIAVYEAQMEKQIENGLKHIDYNTAKKLGGPKTSGGPFYDTNDTVIYDIPIVIHVIHNYGPEYLSDDSLFSAFADWCKVYMLENYDTSLVIPTFKKWIGNPHIRLHLATVDPYGNPTKGITRHRSYLSYGVGGGDQAKLDDWSPTSYVNIWIVNSMSAGNQEAAAYAYEPPDAAATPYYDGVISLYSYVRNAYDGQPYAVSKTINHELGHVFNLEHPWGNDNNPAVACGDDGVDDTPPTKGHNPDGCVASDLYDTACCQHYFKVYPSSVPGVDSLVDYPDTANAQNIMDYTYCARMFTKGQVERMHIALNSDVAGRDSLWAPFNLQITGALASRPDLAPIPAYSAWTSVSLPTTPATAANDMKYFTAVGGAPIYFRNESWNDTITKLQWSFSNGASIPSETVTTVSQFSTPVVETFTSPGWVGVTLAATGNTGSAPGATTTTVDSSVYVADSTGINPTGYFEEFKGGDVSQWPMFNYFNNTFKWQIANTGYYDNSSVEYVGYDSRSYPETVTGAPTGDFDDLYSPAFDLSGFGSATPNLDFMYSGQSRSSLAYNMNDSLDISYSSDLTKTWHELKELTATTLDNQGASNNAFQPSWMGQWSPETIALPAAAKTTHTIFRFRYFPNQDQNNLYSTGNNFYMDRVFISTDPADVNLLSATNAVAVVPNPTHGDAYVLINNTGNDVVKVQVSDIAGRVVYTTEQQVVGKGSITIPRSSISVSGMYLVQIVNGNEVRTEKLVVY